MHTHLRVGVLLVLIALVLPGCITAEQARAKLTEYVEIGREAARHGALAVCTSYPALAGGWQTFISVSPGTVNAATVRDVQVAIDILDSECPGIVAGTRTTSRAIANAYARLMQAAANARKGLP